MSRDKNQKTDFNKISPKIVTSKSLPLILGAVFLLIIVAVGAYLYFSKNSSDLRSSDKGDVAYKILDVEYFENDVRNLGSYQMEIEQLPEQEAIENIAETQRFIAVALSEGVAPDDEEVEARVDGMTGDDIKNNSSYKSKYQPWLNLKAKQELITEYYENKPVVAVPSGNVLVFYFGQHIQYSYDSKPDGLNDPNLIKEDREYASEKAQYYHDQIKNKKISPKDAYEEIKNDQRYKGQIFAINPFGKSIDMSWQEQVYYESAINYISSATQVGLSDVMTGKLSPGPDDGADKQVDAYYYFVDIESLGANQSAGADQFKQKVSKTSLEYSDKFKTLLGVK